MSEHSNVENSGWRPKGKGFSLVELMITIGISTILALGVGSVFVYAIEQFHILVEQNHTEENLLWASFNLRGFLSQGINIGVANTPFDVARLNAGVGQILSAYDSRDAVSAATANPSPDPSVITAFVREASTASSSSFNSTALFFVPAGNVATNNPSLRGGALVFDAGAPAGAPVVLSPDFGDVWFDRVSEFRIMEIECVSATGTLKDAACVPAAPDFYAVKSATFLLKMRYFKTSNKNQWIYCDPTDVPAGVPLGAFRDIEMTIKVGFRNNILLGPGSVGTGGGSKVGSTAAERLFGGVYFFRMVMPPLNQ